ncbi:DUF742 domain-containing protein [Salinispora arenicola]|uniref:Uncharacterized protein DUF742 n=2 Tax=Salinispora arenicola TaxID=168697 RepID=A0A542XQC6_SALAC|nr:DUF742 domain-containing protein [Salinispora arenicola]MCN0153042.1 DUF742 domain-containing protein [Salinispora arenicola]MCN0178444.1 DUF742 domain-containing protein [Salinispora arenicola]NIL41015.1 DUF742 domain-containing protein [Salinispora arenicola]NIL58802.1 DUF742 domain-containing protein [Salinispora arenicola]NIL60511.1 DUF742 domain-containing protein [Salinispora arenicola]
MNDTGPRLPDPRMIPHWTSTRSPAVREPQPHPPADPTDEAAVRPFLLTGGRTRPVQDGLRVETLLFAQPAALSAPLRFEAHQIVTLCQRPTSVADLAVAMRVPLGVVRVLAADLLTEGHLRREEQGEFSLAMLERIRDRVRAL